MRINTRVDANGFRIYKRGCERFWAEGGEGHGGANVVVGLEKNSECSLDG